MRLLIAVWSLALACGPADEPPLDAHVVDAEVVFDGGLPEAGADAALDAAVVDAAVDASTDASAPDGAADAMATAFGTIVGPCGRVMDELGSPTPSLFVVRFDFMDDPYDDSDFERLTEGAREILTDGSAGGNSVLSEALSYEVLARCEGASLVATETEVVYDPPSSKKTDLVVSFGVTIGVSVVRAFRFPGDVPFAPEDATPVIEGKLADVLVSTMNATSHEWDKQILAVVAWDTMAAESVMSAWASLDEAVRADTIVYVIVTDGMDRNVYITGG